MSKFKVGDIVVLKSGSPKLTVRRSVRESVWVDWFNGPVYLTAILKEPALSTLQEAKDAGLIKDNA